jgi:subtilisin family serine protease
LTLGAAAVCALGLTAVVGTAANGDETGGVNVTRFAHVDSSLLANAKGFVPAALSNKPVTVMLEMAGDPVAVQDVDAKQKGKSLSKDEKDAIRADLKAKQDGIVGSIQSAGGTVAAQLQSAYNGVQVVIAKNAVPQLATLPGVVAVHSVQTFKPSNTHGVPFIGGDVAWGSFHETGAGVRVAVIDTGIDYTHADFGGPGTAKAWSQQSQHSASPPPKSMVGPDAPKVKGGYDFVGDSYNADPTSASYQPTPQPDSNPLDCNGHGSHTAGTAAGFGVLGNGTTYTGPYDANTIASHDWSVGPGVAPQADIYAYRVFGCQGSSDIVAAAIDRAVADGVDVISMSLGSDFGGQDDPTTVASENAARDGVTVVAAAGNAGGSAYMVSSPSTGSHVLSVAAMDASLKQYPGAAISTSPEVDTIVANGVTTLPSGSLPVKVLKNADGSIALGCNATDYAGTAGAIVVTMRGVCARVARAIYGQQAGAAAVVMVNSSPGLPPYEGPIYTNPDTGAAYHVTIPFLGADQAAGPTLRAADGTSVTLSSKPIPNSGYQQVASFSSGGPRNPDSAPKPEVIAPGVSVASVGMGSGTGFVIESGTSMATPMTAGVAALVKQAHPSWSAYQVKAAIQNTADPSLETDYNVRRAGSGVVQAQKAVDSTVLAQTADGLNSIAFGLVPGTAAYTASKTVTLSNTGSASASYAVAVQAVGGQLGASVTASPSSVSVAAGGTATVTVSVSISSSAFASLPSVDTFDAAGPGGILTTRGDVVLTPSSGSHVQTLTVPYLVAPRGLSNLTASAPKGKKGSWTTRVTNGGIHTGTAGLYAWGIQDEAGTGDTADVRDVGVQVTNGSELTGATGDPGIYFGISTNKPSATQAINEYDVLVDTNNDGATDYVVVGADLGGVLSGSLNGQMASFIFNATTGALVDAWYAEAPMNGSFVQLPLLASEIGLGSGHGRFSYSVQSFALVTGATDTTSSASFDAFTPAVSTGELGAVAPGGRLDVPLTANQAQLALTPVKGWLLMTPDDATAGQADEVTLPS